MSKGRYVASCELEPVGRLSASLQVHPDDEVTPAVGLDEICLSLYALTRMALNHVGGIGGAQPEEDSFMDRSRSTSVLERLAPCRPLYSFMTTTCEHLASTGEAVSSQ